MREGTVTFYTRSHIQPKLELKIGDDISHLWFEESDDRRVRGEHCWVVRPWIPDDGEWLFRIELGNGTYAAAYGRGSFDYFHSKVPDVWIQGGEFFSYRPQANLTDARVMKVQRFFGRLPRRPLYIYLPRGYDQHHHRRYPVLYMHDGQNVFESYSDDSFAGSWRADWAANDLIAKGLMRECIIVGVSNGEERRIEEYLPPDYSFSPPGGGEDGLPMSTIKGHANRTYRYYDLDVAPFVNASFRTLPDRENTATCGSSMGGLFTTYLAWEFPKFAKHHAAMSPSYWITGDLDSELDDLRIIEKMRYQTPPDIRIWLDSGTRSTETRGNDGRYNTLAARDALMENGFVLGDNLGYFLHEGATHSEGSWADRFPRVLQFLFPLRR